MQPKPIAASSSGTYLGIIRPQTEMQADDYQHGTGC